MRHPLILHLLDVLCGGLGPLPLSLSHLLCKISNGGGDGLGGGSSVTGGLFYATGVPPALLVVFPPETFLLRLQKELGAAYL